MVDFLCLPSYLCYEFYNVCNNYKMEKLGNVFQGEVSLLIGKKMPWRGNTFLMDVWLRLGPWLFYGRKCDMGDIILSPHAKRRIRTAQEHEFR